MNSRQKVGDFLSIHSRPVFSGSARAVDTYSQKQADPNAGALETAIGKLDAAFSPVLKKETRQAAKKEYEEGEALFEKNRLDFGEAVRSGDIRFGASPFTRRGYRESQLEVLGANYNIELERALEHSNLHEIDDPAQIEEFIGKFRQEYMETNGIGDMPEKEVARVFQPVAQQAQDRFRNAQADRNITFVEEQRVRSFEQELYTAISTGNFDGPEGSASANAQNLGQWLSARSQELYEEGVDYKVIEKMVLGVVEETASASGSHAVSGLLNAVNLGGMGPLGKTSAGRETQRRITKSIAAAEARRNKAAAKAADAEDDAKVDDLIRRAQQAARDGDKEVATTLVEELELLDPDKARTVYNAVRSWTGDVVDSDADETYRNMMVAVKGSDSARDAKALVDEQEIGGAITAEQANRLRAVAERNFTPGPTQDALGVYESESYVVAQSKTFAQRYPAEDYFKTPLVENIQKVSDGTELYEDGMIKWIQDNMDEDGHYDRLEMRKYAKKLRDDIVETLGPAQGEDEDIAPPSWATE
jgi:hypothetical protein